MSRNTEYQFVDTDTDVLVAQMVEIYEQLTGTTVRPASPERLFIQWTANIILQERTMNNYTGNQNLPSRAEGENLDALGELFFEMERPAAQAAVSTERFTISAAQTTAILVPAGTRVTDAEGKLYWRTSEDAYIEIGDTYVDIPIVCETAGVVGNGYAAGQINTIVDVFEYYASCSNTTESDDGADEATDDEYYDIMRESMDGYSCAGARGGYVYFARQVSTEIADVLPNQPSAGCVNIYVLMDDGTLATTEVKNAVLAACSSETVRPLTDFVSVVDAETSAYNIIFTYYITSGTTRSATEIEADVSKAVSDYVAWQCAKFGRDINPDKLREYVLAVDGIKRLVLTSPSFTVLRDGKDNTVPQVAAVGTTTVTNGGYEDE